MKKSLWDIIKIILIVIILFFTAALIYTIVDSMRTSTLAQNIFTVFQLILLIGLTYLFYKPIKYTLKPKSKSGKILCIVVSLFVLSFEYVGLSDTIEAIFSNSKQMPKFWYLYIIALIALCIVFYISIKKHKYNITDLDMMEGHQFEYACADILRYNGFSNVKVTQGSGDFGVDILAEKNGLKYAVQCKCYSFKLDNTPIQEVIGGLAYWHCDKGAVMTNQYFTEPAKELARVNNVELWDRNTLIKLISKTPSRRKQERERKKIEKGITKLNKKADAAIKSIDNTLDEIKNHQNN